MSTHCDYKNSIGIQEINKMTSRLKYNRFIKWAWDDGDIYKIYDEVVKILPDLTFSQFDDYAQYRTIFHSNFVSDCNEIAHCMAGVK